jgi:hypothetical protein
MFLNKLREALLATPYAKPYKDEYVWVRCPICGDSVRRFDKPHCTIWLRPDMPVVFHCWICEASGLVTYSFLKDLGMTDVNLYSELAHHNKTNSKKKTGSVRFASYKEYQGIQVPKLRENDPFVERKIEYMRNRIGVPYTCSSLEYMRVITSMSDFLMLNNLSPTGKWNIRSLDENYIGFLSSDKSMITLRDVTNTQKLKYIKYNVFNAIHDGECFYSIPMPADPLEDEMDLNICEGTFDLHGVFFNVKQGNTDRNIYVAVCGSGYTRVLKYFLRKGFLTNLNVNIYSDSDKSPFWYAKSLESFEFWFKSVNLYYNNKEGEKDFGVRKEQIETRKAVLNFGKRIHY